MSDEARTAKSDKSNITQPGVLEEFRTRSKDAQRIVEWIKWWNALDTRLPFPRRRRRRRRRFCDGVEALAKLHEHAFDLVLMNVHMPVMDGITTMQIMRERGYPTPVVVLTADVTDQNRVRCKEAGALAVLFKPINMKELVRTMKQILEKPGGDNAGLAKAECCSLSFIEHVDAEVKRALTDNWKGSLLAALKQMEHYCESQDWKSLKKVAHSEKGAAAQIGACTVSVIAKKIEFEAKAEKCDRDRVAELVEKLTKVARETFAHLSKKS